LQHAIAAGLAAGGLQPVILGVVPTPALALAVTGERAALGVMITASHNPAGDNGIKFFNDTGLKLSDAQELAIEDALNAAAGNAEFPLGGRREAPPKPPSGNSALPAADGLLAYLQKMSAILTPRALEGWRVALDTANGATCMTSPVVLGALGAELFTLGGEPNGHNINDGVGSEHPQKLSARVRETGARLGIAHDGDGDRCILCDERGDILDGDEILTILALRALASQTLAARTLVVTVHSNLGVDAAIRAAGGRVARAQVGDRHVAEKMREVGATLGGESSGHIIFSDIARCGDGLLAALKTIEVMLATGKPLSELRRVLKKFPQATKNLRVREKRALAALPKLSATIAALERELGGNGNDNDSGRVLVRYSGTEPKLRLLVEGPTDAVVSAGIARLENAARDELEVC